MIRDPGQDMTDAEPFDDLFAADRTVHEVLERIVQRLGDFGWGFAATMVYDEVTRSLLPGPGCEALPEGLPNLLNRPALNAGCCSRAVGQRGAVEIRDLDRDPEWRPYHSWSEEAGVRSVWALPIALEGRSFGAFAIFAFVPLGADGPQMMTARWLARYAAMAISRIRLLEENHRLALAVSHLKTGVLISDPTLPDNPIIFSNRGFEELTGYGPEETLGRNARFLQGPETNRRTARAMREAIEHGRPIDVEMINYRKDGSTFWNEVRLSPVFDETGTLKNYIGLQTDVTERKSTEKEHDELSRWNERILNSVGEGIYGVDTEGVITFCNPAAASMLGYEKSELIGRAGHEILHHSRSDGTLYEREECPNHTVLLGRADRVASRDAFWRKDGTWFPAEFVTTPIIEAGVARGAVVTFRDVTAEQEAARALGESETRFREVFHHANDMMFLYSLGEDPGEVRLVEVNRTAEVRLMFSREELLGATPKEILDTACPGRIEGVDWEAFSRGLAALDWTYVRSDGAAIPAEVSGKAFEQDGERYLLTVARDISERREAEQTIYRMAYHDELTGLPNRRMFHRELTQAVKMNAGQSSPGLSVLFVDLDNFKKVNDSFGHAAGDALLRAVAERVSACLAGNGEKGLVSRWGGDELLAFIPGADRAKAEEAAHEIVRQFRRPFSVRRQWVFVTISVGIAVYPEDGGDADSLIRAADSALHWAKTEGKDQARAYKADLHWNASNSLRLESGLRRALERNEFVLYYQPEISARTGRVEVVEALARWSRPGVGLVYPSEFIEAAESSGIIVPIGEQVLRKACRQAQQWRVNGHPDLRVAVNISARQFQQADFTQMVMAILRESGLPADHLEIEITETALMQIEQSLQVLGQLRQFGVKVTVDDFGTGFSSLQYLQSLPIQSIKIDRSFLARLDSENGLAIVKSIIYLAHRLKMEVVAEGVETAAQHEFLIAEQCDRVQGYLYSPPISSAAFRTFLRGRGSGSAQPYAK